jgi:FkbH-like protein
MAELKSIQELINTKEIRNISDFFSLDRKIERMITGVEIPREKIVNIAIISSFTVNGIKEILNVKCFHLGINSKYYISPYNQYTQDILNKESSLYKFRPDIIFLFIDTKSFFGDYFFFPYRLSDEERRKTIEKSFKELQQLTGHLIENTESKVVVSNFEIPVYSSMGILENKSRFGFIESLQELNIRLRELSKNHPRLFIFDFENFCSKHGKENIIDYKMYYLADMKLQLKYFPFLCDEYISYIKPLMSLTKKCLVLDLDNTLWGGILGEDGIENIKLGPSHEGKPFFEFQKHILSLYERGIILAVNSKNSEDDVHEVFEKHPYMILKEDHFAALKINWTDKVQNMQEIANEINIGLDSLVFFDDDIINRRLMNNYLPEVLVIDVPDDPSYYTKALMDITDFNAFQITSEDTKRGESYTKDRKRKELKTVSKNINEFLQQLDMKVSILNADDFAIPRIAQLIQRTNQFNMTTKRYSEEQIRSFSENDLYTVWAVKVEDKFGDNGIVGVIFLEKPDSDYWIIDTFLLSCRILGREIEAALLHFIMEKALNNGVKRLIGLFIPTKKNIPARDFYKINNFVLDGTSDNDEERWIKDIKKAHIKRPNFIEIVEDGRHAKA